MDTGQYEDLIPDIGYFIYRSNTPDWKIEESITDFVDITYVVSGRAVYYIDGKEYHVSGGDLVCVPKNRLRSAAGLSGELLECFSANFQLRTLTGETAALPLPLVSHIGCHADITARYRELNEEWLRRDPGYQMRARAHFMLILQRYFLIVLYKTDTSLYDARVRAAIRYMTDHYTEPLSVREAAAYTGLSPVYFGALFKKATGIAYQQYLTVIRLNQAENMLRAGTHNVSEASLDCGFTDVYYFSRQYKKYKGAPPSAHAFQRRCVP